MTNEVIDPGEYVARVASAYRNHDGLVLVRLAIVDPDDDTKMLTEIVVALDPKTPMKFLRFLRSVGYPTPEHRFFVNLSDLRGRFCRVQTEQREWPNKTTGIMEDHNGIARFLPREFANA